MGAQQHNSHNFSTKCPRKRTNDRVTVPPEIAKNNANSVIHTFTAKETLQSKKQTKQLIAEHERGNSPRMIHPARSPTNNGRNAHKTSPHNTDQATNQNAVFSSVAIRDIPPSRADIATRIRVTAVASRTNARERRKTKALEKNSNRRQFPREPI